MVLGCALELGIPDIIHNHQKPITLQELVSKLNISVDKTLHLQRLMRLLIHQNFFSVTKFHDEEGEDEKEGYVLTVSSKLLLKNSSSPTLPNLLPFVNLMVDHVTTFESLGRNPRFNTLFNDAIVKRSVWFMILYGDCIKARSLKDFTENNMKDERGRRKRRREQEDEEDCMW
ncbi:hypothetical protein L2E82_39988 [Cichorium intybus]|uniref:Uncharacterized protein n=1 Tax=Cichorium intybus TaxID=13427 RepID=A0ACB9AKR6_CICIN|nr:hypothetical protein L2E82_39988 [Cichorium intybus]